MSLPVEKSQLFETDVASQFAWYVDAAGEKVAVAALCGSRRLPHLARLVQTLQRS